MSLREEAASSERDAPLEGELAAAGLHDRSVRDRLIHGTAWVLAGKIASSVLGLALNAILARLLSPSELGAYFTTLTLVMIGSSAAQLGLDLAVVRLVSAALGTGDPARARAALRKTFVYGAAGAVAAAVLLVAGGGRYFARDLLHSALVQDVMPVAAGWLIALALQSLVIESFRGFQRFDLATIFDALFIYSLATAIFGIAWILHRHVSLTGVAATIGAVTAVAALVGGRYVLGRVSALRKLETAGPSDPLPTRDLFAIAWPLLVTNVTVFLVGSGVDIWILGAFRPQPEVALYGAASRLVAFVSTPFIILQGVAPPLVAEMYAQGKRRELERTLRVIATLGGLPAFGALLLFLIFGHPILAAIFGGFYRRAATILALLSFGRLVGVWTGSCGVTLMMTGHQRAMMYITLSSGILSVAGGLALVPRFGATGVAVATMIGIIVNNCLQMVYARRLVGVWTAAELSPARVVDFLRKDSGRLLRRGR